MAKSPNEIKAQVISEQMAQMWKFLAEMRKQSNSDAAITPTMQVFADHFIKGLEQCLRTIN